MALRITNIVSTQAKQEQHFIHLKQRLLQHGYPLAIIDNAIQHASQPLNSQHRQSTSNKILHFTVHHSTHAQRTSCATVSLISHLQQEPTTTLAFKNFKPLISYNKSSYTMQYLQGRSSRIFKCNRPRCLTCKIIQTGSSINLPNRAQFFPNTSMTCTSTNVIYCIICKSCNRIYVGSTSTMLTLRMNLHRSQTVNKKYTILFVNPHIQECSNNAFLVVPIYRVSNTLHSSVLLSVEHFFIQTLAPELNSSNTH